MKDNNDGHSHGAPARAAMAQERADRTMTFHPDWQMTTERKRLLDDANALVPRISPPQAKEMIAHSEAVVVDLRAEDDVGITGMVSGALAVSILDLGARADPSSPSQDKRFDMAKPVIVYCANGTNAAFGGKILKDLGFRYVFNLGAYKDWAESSEALPAAQGLSFDLDMGSIRPVAAFRSRPL